MKERKNYYSTSNIRKHNADINIIFGEKSNGKSYAVKKDAIEDAIKGKGSVIYVRRYDFDIKTKDVEAYFADAPISELTKGEYNGVIVKSRVIYLALYEDGEKVKQSAKPIGRAVNISGYEHFASQNFGKVGNIIVEEFFTVRNYLFDEPNELLKLISTIVRDDNDCKVWLIGNTVNRVCPYIRDWGLVNLLKQKQGTIDTYNFERTDPVSGEKVITKICCEYCENAGNKSVFAFGKSSKMIAGGEWHTDEQPRLPKPIEKFDMVYELLLSDLGFSYVMQLLIDKDDGGQIIYVYPYTKNRNIQRKITKEFSSDPFISPSFNSKIRAEVLMKELFLNRKICFSDNLTGTDFYQVLSNRNCPL